MMVFITFGGNMKRIFLLTIILTLLAACSPSPIQNQTLDSELSSVDNFTPTLTKTPKPTSTPRPTNTPILPKPEDTVEKFFKAAQKFEGESMAAFIDPSKTELINEIKSINSSDDEEMPKFLLELFKTNSKKIDYKITEVIVDGSYALVTVDAKYVDSGPILKGTLAEAFSKIVALAFSGVEITDDETDELFQTTMKEQIALINETFKEATLNINLIMVDSVWYLRDIDETLKDVIMSGFVSAGSEISEAFSTYNETP